MVLQRLKFPLKMFSGCLNKTKLFWTKSESQHLWWRLADLSVSQAMDVLDNEASEDEAARKYTSLDRLPSHEANAELIAKEKRYRAILAQAAASDESVRQKWDEWEQSIIELTWSEVWNEVATSTSPLSSALL